MTLVGEASGICPPQATSHNLVVAFPPLAPLLCPPPKEYHYYKFLCSILEWGMKEFLFPQKTWSCLRGSSFVGMKIHAHTHTHATHTHRAMYFFFFQLTQILHILKVLFDVTYLELLSESPFHITACLCYGSYLALRWPAAHVSDVGGTLQVSLYSAPTVLNPAPCMQLVLTQ